MTAVTCTNTPTQKVSFSPLAWIVNALKIRQERRVLSTLTDAQLDDIGLTPAQARREAERALWDAPKHWLR